MRTTFSSSDYVFPTQIDWEQIFSDLEQYGLSVYNVAELIGKTGSTVQRWAKGQEPRKAYADAILTIHENWCGETKTVIRILEANPL